MDLPKCWDSSKYAKKFINETRNLEANKPEDVTALEKGIHAGGTFDHSLSGTSFSVTTCPIPELDFYVAALT